MPNMHRNLFRVLAHLSFGGCALAAASESLTALTLTTLTSTTTLATSTTTITLTLSRVNLSFSPAATEPPLASSTASALPSSTMLASLADQVLNTTNRYRAQHEAPPVTWNSTLAAYAEDYAQRCVWKHSGGPYGENLAANFERTTLAIDAWGMEESKYNYGKADFDEVHGHFTQLVWQNTTQVGCGVADCHNHAEHGVTGAYLVCEYAPRGNVPGEFQDNVVKPGMGEDGKLGIGGGSGFSDGLRTYTVTLLVIYVVFALCFLC